MIQIFAPIDSFMENCEFLDPLKHNWINLVN